MEERITKNEIVGRGKRIRYTIQYTCPDCNRTLSGNAYVKVADPVDPFSRLARVPCDSCSYARMASREDERAVLNKTIRRAMQAKLQRLGFTLERSDGGSNYFTRLSTDNDIERIRISDHEVPITDERDHNSRNGGFSWAVGGNQIIITDFDTPEAALEKLCELI